MRVSSTADYWTCTHVYTGSSAGKVKMFCFMQLQCNCFTSHKELLEVSGAFLKNVLPTSLHGPTVSVDSTSQVRPLF
jgi:hypothetical protein